MELVGQLLHSSAWSEVTTIGRREVVVAAAYQVCMALDAMRLVLDTTHLCQCAYMHNRLFYTQGCISCSCGKSRKCNYIALIYQGYDAAKLAQKVVNMDDLADDAASAFDQTQTVFCTLGTTRKVKHYA